LSTDPSDPHNEQDDAETYGVVPPSPGGPIDPPDEHRTLYANVVQRRDEPLRPIVPAEWRNRNQRRQVLRWMAWYAGYLARFHGLRTPKYAGKAALWAPVGAVRLVGRQVRWWWLLEQHQLRQDAARRNDVDAYLKLHQEAKATRAWRGGVLAVEAVALTVAGVLLATVAPWWLVAPVVLVAVLVLARLGRPADKPITDRVSTGPQFTKLTGEMVRTALVALGISRIKEPGDLSFPPPGIHRDGPGWLARVNLPAGVEVTEVLERRGRLSSALRLPVDQVWPTAGPEHAGQLDLWVGYLPSSKMGQPRWSLASPTARTSVFDLHEFGTDQRQRPVKTALFAQNFLVGGRPGSGKSFGARTLATIAALDPTCELKIIEYKGTGDFLDFEPLCSTYTCGLSDQDFATGASVLTWGLAEAERRGERIRKAYERGEAPERKVTPELARRPGSGLHPVFILIDEAHELFGDDEHGGGAKSAAIRLAKRGRALGITLVICTQIPDKDSLPTALTRCIGIRWCMAVPDQVANDQILGTGAYKRGLTGTAYRPVLDAGWGIMLGLAEPTAVRSQYPDPATTRAILARATALRGGEPVGTDVDTVPVRDVLDDVLRVFAYLGRPGVTWQQLAELLATEHPEAYGSHSQESLSALVRAAGVPTVDVKSDGKGLKGCKRTDVEAAVRKREITDGG
jgi:S-DNA-T family DNA segregation ATPase FtsK/SpoIIIE